jgi:hypothetical protein
MRKRIIAVLLILVFAGGIACADNIWEKPRTWVLFGAIMGAAGGVAFLVDDPPVGWACVGIGGGAIVIGLVCWFIDGGDFFAAAQKDPVLKNVEVDIRPTSVTFGYSFKF